MSDLSFTAGVGLNGSYTVKAPISKKLLSNIYVANYFTPTGLVSYNSPTAFPPAFNDSSTSTAVTAVGPNLAVPPKTPPASAGSNVPGSAGAVGQPFYEYRCYDIAQELNARIRVMVRSWDVKADVGVSTGPYQVTPGTESDPFTLFPKHDSLVLDDMFISGEVTAPTSNYTYFFFSDLTTGITAYSDYRMGFPMGFE
jgi:hypothetical protein